LEASTIQQIRDALLARGWATAEDMDRHLSNVASGRLDLATSPMVTAWGRRREGPGRRQPSRGPDRD